MEQLVAVLADKLNIGVEMGTNTGNPAGGKIRGKKME